MRRFLERRFRDRIMRAVSFDVRLYERLTTDGTATEEAIGVVVLSSLAAGVGIAARSSVGWMVVGTIVSLVGWCVWASVTYLVGTKVLPGPRGRTDLREWVRPLGYSAAPGLFRVVGILSPLTEMVYLVAGMWMLVTMVIAVQAVDFGGRGRAVGVSLIGWVLYMFLEYVWFPVAVA